MKGAKIIWAILVFLLLATLGVAQNEKGVVFYNERTIPTYHFKGLTTTQMDSLKARWRIQAIITQTYDDELHGIVDLKKYDEIRHLVEKLPNGKKGKEHD